MAHHTYSFKAFGHPNIKGTHMNTLEITKDKEVSKKGNCIIAVGADFKRSELAKLAKLYGKLRMTMKVGSETEETVFTANKEFSSDGEIVLRLGDFLSERTLGTGATKTSKLLSRKIMKLMRIPEQEMKITVEPAVKVLIFDLDGTLENFDIGKMKAYKLLGDLFYKKYGIYPDTTARLLEEVDHSFVAEAEGKGPEQFDRRRWFPEFFKLVGVKVTKKEIDEYVRIYWDAVNHTAKWIPGAKKMLRALAKKYILVLMSDADGPRKIKEERMKLLGVEEKFDLVIVGNDVGVNKPNVKFYDVILKKFGVKPEECVMIGDKPWADLVCAKNIKMQTVWVRQGKWGSSDEKYQYVDLELEKICDLPKILEKI